VRVCRLQDCLHPYTVGGGRTLVRRGQAAAVEQIGGGIEQRPASDGGGHRPRGPPAPPWPERGVTTRDLCPLAARIFAHGATPEAAAVAECEVERRLIVPDLDVVALLGHLRDAGKLIVAVSDTY